MSRLEPAIIARLRLFVEPRPDGSPQVEDAAASAVAPSPEGMVVFSAVGVTLSPRAVTELLDAWDASDPAIAARDLLEARAVRAEAQLSRLTELHTLRARAELAESQLAQLCSELEQMFQPEFARLLRQLATLFDPSTNPYWPAVSDVAARGTEAASVSDDGDRMSPSDAAGRSPQSEGDAT